MEKKIIIHHLNELTIGGTEKTTQIILKELDSYDDNYIHYLAYKRDGDKTREPFFMEILGKERMLSYGSKEEFINIISNLKPYVLHRYAAGIPEWPFVKEVRPHVKHFVSTSIFGNQDNTIDIKKVIYVSQHLKNIIGFGSNEDHVVIRTPVEPPKTEEDLREELDIPKDAFVFGRIGRDDNNIYNPINLFAYSKVETENTYFVIVAPSELCKRDIEKLKIKNYRYVDKTTDDVRLSRFYNTIDVLAHARKDGECNPSNVWEAAAHGKPVISHYGTTFNGHIETIQDSGFVVSPNDFKEYIRIMKSFIDGTINYSFYSAKCKERWQKTCTPDKLAKQYINLLDNLD